MSGVIPKEKWSFVVSVRILTGAKRPRKHIGLSIVDARTNPRLRATANVAGAGNLKVEPQMSVAQLEIGENYRRRVQIVQGKYRGIMRVSG